MKKVHLVAFIQWILQLDPWQWHIRLQTNTKFSFQILKDKLYQPQLKTLEYIERMNLVLKGGMVTIWTQKTELSSPDRGMETR